MSLVLDDLIDKVVSACNDQMQKAGLDPLTIEDIAIPFSLDQMSGSCGPLGGLLSIVCSCLSKSVQVLCEISIVSLLYRSLDGEIFLKNGQLSGLSSLSRSIPTRVEVEDGSVKLSAGIAMHGLQTPFEPSISVYQPSSDPEVRLSADVGE